VVNRRAEPSRRADGVWIIALVIAFAGFAVRVSTLGDFWLSADEGIYYHVANAPAKVAALVVALNAHPPLHYWMLRAVASIDSGFVWLRVPSVISGSLAIFAMYLLGRQTGGRICGITAALLLAFSPGAIMLSQVARPYMPMLLFLVLALFFLLRFVSEGVSRDLWLYAALMITALLFHYASFAVVATAAGVLAILAAAGRLDARAIKGLAIAHLPIALVMAWLYLAHIGPGLMGSAIQADAVSGRLQPFFVTTPLEAWRNLLGLIAYIAGPALVGAASLAFIASLIACLAARKLLVVALASVALAVSVGLSELELYPFGSGRHSFHLAPFLMLVVATGVSLLAARSLKELSLVLAALAALILMPAATERALGLAPDRPRVSSERRIRVAEVEQLLVPLTSIIRTPGLLVMDGQTAHTLAPLIEKSWRGVHSRPDLPFHWFSWEEREVILTHLWRLEVRHTGGDPQEQLDAILGRISTGTPELARAMRDDVRLLSARGSSVPRSLRALARDAGRASAPFANPVQTRHFSIIQLDVEAYRQVLAETPPRAQPRSITTDGERL